MGSSPQILVVEGQTAGRESLAAMLEKAGYETAIARTGTEAQNWLAESATDLIVFDASTMRSNGVRNCRRLRRQAGSTPIIHCRGAGEEEDRAAGADVYLEKPFTPRKLLNRVRALLPADRRKEEIVRYGNITLYRIKRSVEVAGRGEFALTPKLALLLETFIKHPNELMTRPQLMQTVWMTDFIGDTRTLDVHIRWVRECIEEDPSRPRLLQTVRGKGYLLSVKPSFDSNTPAQETP
ncbi:response regulator transcription factor [Promineifilum sp.]|uniref:response regulator transcription factor n=1 Tax=Promineifilum sp. TaxID=2664178 RepID=UPI0031CCB567